MYIQLSPCYSVLAIQSRPLLRTFAIVTEKIQIPGKGGLTGNGSWYYWLSLLRPISDVPRVSTITKVDCTCLWNRLFPSDEKSALSALSFFSSVTPLLFIRPQQFESPEKTTGGGKPWGGGGGGNELNDVPKLVQHQRELGSKALQKGKRDATLSRKANLPTADRNGGELLKMMALSLITGFNGQPYHHCWLSGDF